jgi:hypothetical protein
MAEDEDQEEVERVRDWIRRLEAFVAALDDIEGTKPEDFAGNAYEAWQHSAVSDMPPKSSPAILIAWEPLIALMKVMAKVAMDWADTPDVRDRLTREDAQRLATDALDDMLSSSQRWLSEGLPSADQIQERLNAVAADMKEAKDVSEKKNAELDAQDEEAAADQYGAILLHRDPSVSDAPIFEKVRSFTKGENTRYVEAYDRLRRMIDSELLQHISDESARLCDVLIGVLRELQSQQVSLADQDAMDERRRKIRSALISFTSALQIHEYQMIRAARQSRDTSQAEAVKELFTDLKRRSFDYRWLEALRDALQHGDINAFKWKFSVSVGAEPEVRINMDRAFMLEFTKETRNRPWLKRRELEEMDSDPSVLNMIKAIQPLMGPLQEKLDKILYPSVADDAAVVKELIGRFNGRQGMYLLQTGPGFTRRQLAPPQFPLAPRVLSFADNYEAEAPVG